MKTATKERQRERLKQKVILKASSFGVKDFNKSFSKWESYKAEKVKTLFENNSEEIKNHIEKLNEAIATPVPWALTGFADEPPARRSVEVWEACGLA